jgi:ABC-2 type transport system ATP-binding protein
MIELTNVTKYYGDFPAITDISFKVEKGERVGFLGPNGAGKSTTMKIITGFMPPSTGTVKVAGYDIVDQSLEARRHIGYMPETVPLYTDMSVTDYLRFMGTIRGMSRSRLRRRIGEVIEVCGLEDYGSTIIDKLSKGFRQRLGIAQSILHEPDVLIMDEPTIGIDPIQVVETRDLIRSLGGDHTLIVSTHILPEVSTICERVIIINEGRIVAMDTPEDLGIRLRGGERIDVEIRGPRREVTQALQRVEGVRNVTRLSGDETAVSTYAAEVDPAGDVGHRIASAIVGAGWELRRLESVTMSLEEIFLRLTTDEEVDA